jgi:hypothetical protein
MPSIDVDGFNFDFPASWEVLKPIDPHAVVVETSRMGGLAWSVK